MIENKILKLLQKTITTLMCFWMLTTQMPINVVFADEINTEENIVEDINEDEINNVDNEEEDQIIIEEDVETEISINQELLDRVNTLLNIDITSITDIDELTNVHDNTNNIIDEYNESSEQANIDYESLLSFKYDVTKLLIDKHIESLPSEEDINTFTDVQNQIAPTRKLVRTTIPSLIKELNEIDQTNYNNNYASLLSDITAFLANRQKQIMNGEAVGATTDPYDAGDGVVRTWTEVNYFPIESGYYYLASDIYVYGSIEIQGKVYLDLKGHTIIFFNGSGQSAINVRGGDYGGNKQTEFHLYDSAGGGEIKKDQNATYARAIWIEKLDDNSYNSLFQMYGGTISDFTGANGGCVYVNGGRFTMSGGTISNNKATSSGGAVFIAATIAGGVFNMENGTISANTANASGGAIFNFGGEFNMTGGTISNNTANDQGGGILAYNNTKTKIDGGTIEENKSGKEDGHGIDNNESKATINIDSGKFYVYANNSKGYSGVTLSNKTSTITFDKNDDTGDTTNITRNWSDTSSSITAPTRVGYTFNGYYNSNGEKYYNANGTSCRAWDYIGAQTLTASWTVITNTITLNPGADATVAGTTSATATYGSPMPSLTTKPSKSGYTFGGYWTSIDPNTQEVSGTQYYDGDGNSVRNWDKTTNTTLYAKWIPKSYAVEFNNNGGTGSIVSIEVIYTEAMPQLLSLPTRAGYEFAGYYDELINGTQYYNADGSSAKNWDKKLQFTPYKK